MVENRGYRPDGPKIALRAYGSVKSMRNHLVLICLYALSGMLTAGVAIHPRPTSINPLGAGETAGWLSMILDGQDFSTASRESPIFIRMRLLGDVRLSETLVDFHHLADERNNVPIYLALRVLSRDDQVRMVAPPDTLSIIRWIAGERDIWLRVRYSSNQWLSLDGQPVQPGARHQVVWGFGDTARASYQTNKVPWSQGMANLPANTRSEQGIRRTGAGNLFRGFWKWAQSSVLAVTPGSNFLEAGLNPDAVLEADWLSFEWNEVNDPHSAQGVPSVREFDGNLRSASKPEDILPGNAGPVNFSGTTTLAQAPRPVIQLQNTAIQSFNSGICAGQSEAL